MSITAMPAEPHPYPIEPAPTPDSTTELRSNGFTAANGGSPSRNSSTAQSDKQGRASQSDDASSESGASSTGKRKEFSSPTIVEFSPKRRRLSQSQPQTNGHPPLRPNGNPHPLPSHNGQQQPKVNGNFEHHRKESGNSDAQLERALTNGMGQEVHSISTSPEQNHQATPAQNERYQYPEGIPEHIPQGGPGNTPSIQRTSGGGRKRVFSNRTKTGCFTCRDRKKKCDEGKPTCANCSRGGFACKGYATNNNASAAATATTTTTTTYKPQPSNQPLQPQQQQQQQQHAYAAYPQYPQGAVGGYYEQPGQARQSIPQQQDPRGVYAPQQWAGTHTHYQPDPMHRQEYQQIVQHQLPSQPLNMTMTKPPPPEPIHPPHNRGSSQTQQIFGQYTAPNGMTTGQAPNQYNNLRVTAQLATNHTPPRMAPPQTEKEKMLGGWPFNHHDKDLKAEREACKSLLYRFNVDASNPETRPELVKSKFKAILETPPNSSSGSSSSPEKPFGKLGKNVEVEAPFHCEYGYNIRIGDEVEIGGNCRIMDSAQVEIGARTIIGPDVKILTLDTETEPHWTMNKGQKRLLRANKIIIGSDVFIGAGSTILAGRKIPNRVTIGAETVVTKDPPESTKLVNRVSERHLNTHWARPGPD